MHIGDNNLVSQAWRSELFVSIRAREAVGTVTALGEVNQDDCSVGNNVQSAQHENSIERIDRS